MEKQFIALVHDKREGTSAYRGVGTKPEVITDVRVLVEGKKIPPRRIQVVPVVGRRKVEEEVKPGSNQISTIITTALATAISCSIIYRCVQIYRKKKKKS